MRFFKSVFGYPGNKTDVLRKIMVSEKVLPKEILVVGDGVSDEKSAVEVGTRFFRIEDTCSMSGISELFNWTP